MTTRNNLTHPKSGITYIDGPRIRRAVVAGVQKVIEGQDHLNKINVFPVADGDTGTNLALTMSSVLGSLRTSQSRHAGHLFTSIADAALDGARGNSGAILAQFFQGISDATNGMRKLSTIDLAKAVKNGEQYAREALSKPREGTVLTVMQDFADCLLQLTATSNYNDFVTLIREGLVRARESLANTPTQLDVLRKAGVVDAGAEGFVRFVEGVHNYIEHGNVRAQIPESSHIESESGNEQMAGEVLDLDYRFCTECMVTGTQIDRRKLRERLSAIGSSVVLAGTTQKAKIHIHSNDPAAIFTLAAEYGRVSGEKADDMHHQQELSHHKEQQVVIAIDSAADMPDTELERLNIHMIPVRLHFGEESYLDKVTIGADEFFEKLQQHSQHPKTSQPSPGELRRNFDFLASHYKRVLSINVTSWGSGTYQGAVTAASTSKHDSIEVFDSKSASVGQALIAIHAAECAQANMPLEEIVTTLKKVRDNTTVFGILPSLAYAVRGGRVKPMVKKVVDFFGVTPVFKLDKQGELKPRQVIIGRQDIVEKLARYVVRHAKKNATYRVAIAYGTNHDKATRLWQAVQVGLHARNAQIEFHFITRLGSALGAHAGPECLVACLQLRETNS